MDKRLVKIGEAAKLLGTIPATLRKWEETGELLPARKTKGGTRYYDVAEILGLNSSIGVDFGIKELAVLSDGTGFKANQPLKKQLKKLAKLQKKVARQKKGSARREMTTRKISRLHYFVTCKRKAMIHEMTSYLTRNYKRIVIEDLNISGMSKNRRLARAILDAGLYEARRQLEYKSHFRNSELVIANRWFASSKIVNCHGHKLKDLKLSDRTVVCPECFKEWDRDHNAAINLDKYSPDRFKRDLNRRKRAT